MCVAEYSNDQSVPRLGVVLNDLVYDEVAIRPRAPNRMSEFIRSGKPTWELLREKLETAQSKQWYWGNNGYSETEYEVGHLENPVIGETPS